MGGVRALVLVAAACAARSSGAGGQLRVQHGRDDVTGLRFVLAVLTEQKHRTCTAILIASTWVVTAAHCRNSIYVQHGDMTVQTVEITIISKILKRIRHPNYRSYKSDYLQHSEIFNDISLMKIEEVKAEIAHLSAVDYNTLIGYEAEFAGFGITNISKHYNAMPDHVKPLQVGSGLIASCRDLIERLFYYPKLCVAPQCGPQPQSMLPGDSGGPLLVDGKVVGISVAVIYPSRVSIFTPISPYMSWIQQIIKG